MSAQEETMPIDRAAARAAFIAELVAVAPPLTQAQKDRLSVALRRDDQGAPRGRGTGRLRTA